jgi:cytochrome P450/NADPH-cytochrome P450 reductase
VASTYLASLAPRDALHVAVRPAHTAFHLPAAADAHVVPLICVAAGAGLAPFRGFVQERAAMAAAGRADLAPMLLFIGCRQPGRDDLYADELAAWERMGVVTVFRTYSRVQTETGAGRSYVQESLWQDRDQVAALWARGAKVYVCGSRKVAQGVKDAVVRIAIDAGVVADGTAAEAWFEEMRNVRFVTDVFD